MAESLTQKRSGAGHLGGTACYQRYGSSYMSEIGRKGGRAKLPTLGELKALRVESASQGQIMIEGGRLLNRLSDLKKLWKLEQTRRGSAAATGTPEEGTPIPSP